MYVCEWDYTQFIWKPFESDSRSRDDGFSLINKIKLYTISYFK